MKKVLILGLGAVGTSLAAQFLDKNYPISILCDIDRKKKYSQNSFFINDRRYDFHYVTNDKYNKAADLIIIAVKYHDLKNAIKQLNKVVGDDTIIMSLLNGIDSEDIIAEKFGYKNLVYSFIYKIDAKKVHNVINYANKGIIVFGEKDGKITERITKLKSIFDEANLHYEISTNIIKKIWWKYMVNIGMNQTTAVLKAPYRVLQGNSYAKKLAKAAMNEVVKISQELDINLTKEDINNEIQRLMNYPPDGKSSMVQDVEGRRKTEVEMLSGRLCKMGEELHIATPVNHIFYNLIRSIEDMY